MEVGGRWGREAIELAATLLELPDGGSAHLDGLPEPMHAVLADARDEEPSSPNRLDVARVP